MAEVDNPDMQVERGAALSSRWLRLLLVAGAVEALLALVVRLDEINRFASGERSVATVIAVVGLAWLLVLLVAVGGVVRLMYRARRRLAVSETAMVSVGATSQDWLWEADTQLRLTYCSPRVAQHLGYQSEDLLGVQMPSLMPAGEAERAWQITGEALASRTGWRDVELTWQHADGHLVTLQGSGEPIFDETDQVVGFRGSRRPVTHAMTVERELIAARARVSAAIEGDEIDVALQPIVDLMTGRLCGAEALARFRDGRSPDVWFADARDCGLGLALDRHTFTAALQTLARLPDDAYLSVNATPELIVDPLWQRELLEGGWPLERLVVEVTEHVEIDRYDEIKIALVVLRERGLRLAIDDTGAGYASFSHVLQLHPDIIKIDRSLISQIERDAARRSLVTALVLLALELDASLTAEGVESSTELDTLVSLGVDCAQGYYLGRPSTDQRRWGAWAAKTWQGSTSPRSAVARTGRRRATRPVGP